LEILQAWQYSEVYVVAFFVASWQLGCFSEWISAFFCNELKSTMNDLFFDGILADSDTECFKVEADIHFAAYLQAFGAILLALLNLYIMKASEQYFRDRDAEKRGLYISFDRTGKELDGFGLSERRTQGTDASFVDGDEAEPIVTVSNSFGNVPHHDSYESVSVAPTDTMSWANDEIENKIRPTPILFVDLFDCTLRHDPRQCSSSRQQIVNTTSVASSVEEMSTSDDEQPSGPCSTYQLVEKEETIPLMD